MITVIIDKKNIKKMFFIKDVVSLILDNPNSSFDFYQDAKPCSKRDLIDEIIDHGIMGDISDLLRILLKPATIIDYYTRNKVYHGKK